VALPRNATWQRPETPHSATTCHLSSSAPIEACRTTRFVDFVKQIIAVLKSEIDKWQAEYEAIKAKAQSKKKAKAKKKA
jgi:hypothetical protein